MKIVIVDYGLGNLGSIKNMLRKIGVEGIVSSSAEDIAKGEKLILPGVGSFDHGMENLKTLNLLSVLEEKVIQKKTPILGICLGMQLFARKSEEGRATGLGWIDADVVRFRVDDQHTKIPHMGWNHIRIEQRDGLFTEMYQEPRFYFVHSYHMVCKSAGDILAKTFHGYEFPSVVRRGNIWGVQFHPEKSHKFGMKLLGNFAAFC